MWNMKGSQQAWRICRNCLHMNMYIHTYTQTKRMHKERWDRTGQKQREIEETRVCSRLKIVQANWKRVSPALQEQSRSTASDIYRFFFFLTRFFDTTTVCFQVLVEELCALAPISRCIYTYFLLISTQQYSEPQELLLFSASAGFFFCLHKFAVSNTDESLQ